MPLSAPLTVLLGLMPAINEIEIPLDQREPLGLILLTPARARGKLTSTEITRIARPILDAHTNFYLQAPLAEDVEACAGSVLCFLRLFWSVEGQAVPRYMLVLTHVAVENDPDLFGGELFDVAAAAAVHREASGRGEDRLDIEAEILQKAMLFSVTPAPRATEAELESAVERIVSEQLRQTLEPRGDWDPFGTIELVTELEGITIQLDDRVLGTTKRGITRMTEVPKGEHSLRLFGQGFTEYHSEVSVEPDHTLRIEPPVERTEIDLPRYAHPTAQWTAVGLVTAGAVLSTIALANTGGMPDSVCLSPAATPQPCPIDAPWAAPAPLGLTLLAGGLSLGIGTLLTPSDETPWLALGVGIAAAAVTAGVLIATDPEDPLSRP